MAKQPRFQLEKSLEGERWFMEHFSGKHDLSMDQPQMKQPIYIHNCEDCSININGKVKRIVLDNCRKVSLNVLGVISGMEIYDCKQVVAKCSGMMPIVTILRSDRCLISFKEEFSQCQLVSSFSSNVALSYNDKSGKTIVYNTPEQIKTEWTGDGFKSTAEMQ